MTIHKVYKMSIGDIKVEEMNRSRSSTHDIVEATMKA